MIVLIGASGSGKSTVAKILKEEYGYETIVTYTTRPKRKGEINGVDYHFVDEDSFFQKFSKGDLCLYGSYRGWHYAADINDLRQNVVLILTPAGYRELMRKKDTLSCDITSFFIDIPRRDRLIKILERGDDIEEAYRRSLSDVGQFDGVEEEVNYVIVNEGYKNSPQMIAKKISNLAKGVDADE